MAKVIDDYISCCSVCAQAKVPRHFPAGKLLPWENPQRLQSHVTIDLLTDLPILEVNTTVMVVMDRFSVIQNYSAIRIIPLPALP